MKIKILKYNKFMRKLWEKFKAKKYFLSVVLVTIFLFSFSLSYTVFKFSNIFVKDTPGTEDVAVIPTPPTATLKEGETNVLLLGYGGAGHEGGTLSDSIILVKADTNAEKVALISIPRDLWVPIPSGDKTQNNKINHAYSTSADAAKYAVSVVTGIPISYFVSVDFNQFQKIIDLLGGIEVNVPKTFDDYFYPIRGKELDLCGKTPEEMQEVHQKYSGFELEKQFECRYEHIHYDRGLNKMTGEEAVKFVRSRHSSEYGGDFARSEKQFAVLEGLKKKLISLNIFPKGGALIDKVSNLARTDLTPEKIKELLGIIGDPSQYQITEIHLTTENVLKESTGPGGQYILIPKDGINNFGGIQNFILGELK
jgi:LCP family protein required for cell wall assembly